LVRNTDLHFGYPNSVRSQQAKGHCDYLEVMSFGFLPNRPEWQQHPQKQLPDCEHPDWGSLKFPLD